MFKGRHAKKVRVRGQQQCVCSYWRSYKRLTAVCMRPAVECVCCNWWGCKRPPAKLYAATRLAMVEGAC
eukprot:1159081-Pelagomonas_calceolata.AAC.5